MGMAPTKTQKGDALCILFGGRFPFVLRRDHADGQEWTLVGTIYVHGIMEVERTHAWEYCKTHRLICVARANTSNILGKKGASSRKVNGSISTNIQLSCRTDVG